MPPIQSTSDRRARRPCARVVQSAKEKEATAKQASTSAQKQARKNAEAAKKRAFQAPVQFMELSEEDDDDDDDDDDTFFDVEATDTPTGPADSAPSASSVPSASSAQLAPVKSTA